MHKPNRWALTAGLLIALIATGCSANRPASTTATTAETHTITGTLSLQGSALADTEVADPDTPNENFTTDKDLGGQDNGCLGTDGYNDIAAGLQVSVSNEDGSVIGNGSLAQGQVVKDELWNNCNFAFSVPVPIAKFYKIAVGHRGELNYSYAELQAAGWNVGFTLG